MSVVQEDPWSSKIGYWRPYFGPFSNHLEDEAAGSNLLNAQVNSITPKEGALILFPSYVEHSVNENLSNEERIVISFNVTIQSKSN